MAGAGGPHAPTSALEVGRRVHIHLRRGEGHEPHTVGRQPADEVAQTLIAHHLLGPAIQGARQDERRAGVIPDAPCNDPAPCTAPTEYEARDIDAVEFHQVDRQQQDAGRAACPADAGAHATRESFLAQGIDDEVDPARIEALPVTAPTRRDDDDEACRRRDAAEQCHGPLQQAPAAHVGERLRLTEPDGKSCGEHDDAQPRQPMTNRWYHESMIPDHVRLRRRPLFTPIWLTAAGAFLGLMILGCATWVWATADSTTVVIVRHAEKQLDAGADPPLSTAGEARAALLLRMFGDTAGPDHLDAIYVSPTMRSRMTAEPLAKRLGLTPVVAPGDMPGALARRVLHEHAGGRILIVGHSDTMNEIVGALGAKNPLPPIGTDDYGTMYVVSVPRIGRANALQLTY